MIRRCQIKLAQFCFHTAFIHDRHLRFTKFEMDKAVKDKHEKYLRNDWFLELFFKVCCCLINRVVIGEFRRRKSGVVTM